jgi:hypothetical protein
LFHITVAIARFFEIMLWDIVQSIGGLVAIGVIVIFAGIASVAGIRKLGRKFTK